MIKTKKDYLIKKREVQTSENFTNMQYYMAMSQLSKEYKDALRMALLEGNTKYNDIELFQIKVDYLKAKQEYNRYKIRELEQENIELKEIYKKEWENLTLK